MIEAIQRTDRTAIISLKYATAIASVSLLWLTGCSSNASHRGPATLAGSGPTETVAKESVTVKKPFMFGEARLPEGYPEPGPVGEVIIKTYPASRVAKVQAREMAGANANGMFWPLFNHIKKENISMTPPVLMGYDDMKPQAERPGFYGVCVRRRAYRPPWPGWERQRRGFAATHCRVCGSSRELQRRCICRKALS